MNDPHVESLTYRVEHGVHVDLSKTAPFEHEEQEFSIRISDRQVIVAMKEHFADVNLARATVERLFGAWELDLALRHGPHTLKFVFEKPVVVDRQPAAGIYTAYIEGFTFKVGSGELSSVTSFDSFPTPPSGILRGAIVDLMFSRYELYRKGGTTLADASYFCLTALELEAGGRLAASTMYGIAPPVLSKLGELSGTKGGATARKAKGHAHDFAANEKEWLERIMPLLVRRAAEVAHDPNSARNQVTLSDLPAL